MWVDLHLKESCERRNIVFERNECTDMKGLTGFREDEGRKEG